jgi:hypothetical protein
MHIEDITKHLHRRAQQYGLVYTLGDPASDILITQTEQRLGLVFPEQVRWFYQHHNGLLIESPALNVLSLDQLYYLAPEDLCFALVDQQHHLCFDVSHLNESAQWDLIAAESRYRVTYTMASFWSNKLWAWINQRRAIWQPEVTESKCATNNANAV